MTPEDWPKEWATEDDAEGFYSDMMLHGNAWSCIGPGGKKHWVPLEDVTARPTAPATGEGAE